ncbi:MAG: hypothetical protein H7345_07020 [Rubritepida sp.]|nr:hypothetical protein [Rubritepida sp.]
MAPQPGGAAWQDAGMELGTRGIRSSGRGSGSIEITLPSRLRALSGLNCQITWQDSPVPQVTLTPDLSLARAALARLWGLLLPALGLPQQPLPAMQVSLYGGTALIWEDALTLSRSAPHEAAAVGQVLAALLILALPAMPPGHAVALAYLATGAVADSAYQADCAIAARAFCPRAAAPLDGFGDGLWQSVARLAPPLQALRTALAADQARYRSLCAAVRTGAPLDLTGLLP